MDELLSHVRSEPRLTAATTASTAEDSGSCSQRRRTVQPHGVECYVDPAITIHVPAQLGCPVPLVRRRLAPVLRADMPETPVDEDRYLACGEDDVRAHFDFAEVELEVLAVAVAKPVQRTAQRHLGLRVRPPVGAHVARSSLVEGRRVEASLVGLPPGLVSLRLGHVHTKSARFPSFFAKIHGVPRPRTTEQVKGALVAEPLRVIEICSRRGRPGAWTREGRVRARAGCGTGRERCEHPALQPAALEGRTG